MNTRIRLLVALLGACAVAAATATAVTRTITVPADPHTVAVRVAAAYADHATNPAAATVAAAAALPPGARALLVPTSARSSTNSGPRGHSRIVTVTDEASARALTELADIGPVGVAGDVGVTAYVATPRTDRRRALPATLAGLGALLAAAAGLALGAGRRRPPTAEPVAALVNRDREDRAALVAGFAELAPRLPAGLDAEAAGLLRRVGVTTVRVDGERFDPARHTSIGTVPAPSAAQAHRVARTERPGFLDHGVPITRPMVVVFDGTGDSAPKDPVPR